MNAQTRITPDLLALGAELLAPKTGIMRGLFDKDTDPDERLLRISVGELRKTARFIQGALIALTPEDDNAPR